uniref:Uracil phosphoribosyltransferase n=1 Tax=Acrosorium ciliolatum TaxID=1550622 RepID=A0A1Z1M1Z5_9FLOR|nr:uracil phosphoribosyltransferase [Acrosorium ciliolatum]ARW60098.1 uracil phosphoribosyltransferase [Acrosorium ciliolatum]
MPLNIYIISHPIIKLLTNSFINNTIQYEYTYKYIGFILIYEILRKYIKIKQIHIKCIYYTQIINILDKSETYYIFTDLVNTYHMITDIKILLPNIKIINFEEKINLSLKEKIKNINRNNNILILEMNLNKYSTIELITQLQKEADISLNKITIGCIKCNNDILEKLGIQYPKLNIYTTQII